MARKAETEMRRARVVALLKSENSVDVICARIAGARPAFVRRVAHELGCTVTSDRHSDREFVRRVKEKAAPVKFSAWSQPNQNTVRAKRRDGR